MLLGRFGRYEMIKSLIEAILVLVDGFVILRVSVFFSPLDSRQTFGQPFAFG